MVTLKVGLAWAAVPSGVVEEGVLRVAGKRAVRGPVVGDDDVLDLGGDGGSSGGAVGGAVGRGSGLVDPLLDVRIGVDVGAVAVGIAGSEVGP